MERHFDDWKREMLAECEVDGKSLAGISDRLATFVEPFARMLATEEQRSAACDYVTGLASDLERKNVESIAYYHQQDRQRLQRFIGWAVWDHRPLLDQLSSQVGRELREEDAVLALDPSAFTKKGTRSVGVQRQWNGRLGKVDNCQLGVYLAYVSRRGAALTNLRLYLPKSWANNRSLRRSCGVPKEVQFATRLQLALEMLDEQGSRRALSVGHAVQHAGQRIDCRASGIGPTAAGFLWARGSMDGASASVGVDARPCPGRRQRSGACSGGRGQRAGDHRAQRFGRHGNAGRDPPLR